MRRYQSESTVESESGRFIDLTDKVTEALEESDVRSGRVTVFVTNDDTRLVVNEKESGLLGDMERLFDRLGPDTSGALLGRASVTVPIEDGRLHLGTWQRILLVSLAPSLDDSRTVILEVTGN
ncbi:MAG: YjbQ family protein [Actinomycetota bacterium]